VKHSTPKPTEENIERFEALKALGCIVCLKFYNCRMSAEIHHLLSGNKRRGHEFTIPLCGWHHRGVTILTREHADQSYGPSLANGSKPFHRAFGSDEDLLAQTNGRLK
jgi:uncharacterized Zn-finger protein